MPDAIIDKGAMMVEFFHAVLAIVAVEGLSWLDDFAIETKILKVYTFFIGKTQYIDNSEVSIDKARLNEASQKIAWCCQDEKNIRRYCPTLVCFVIL